MVGEDHVEDAGLAEAEEVGGEAPGETEEGPSSIWPKVTGRTWTTTASVRMLRNCLKASNSRLIGN